MPSVGPRGDRDVPAVVLDLPFTGLWLTQNSPAARVPSHGTDLFGTTYAIDFVAADRRRRTAARRDWRTLLGTEPVDRFLGFGRPILSPADGVVAAVHDAEPDHPARRSTLALVPYALGQAARVRRGISAVAGNHVIIALGPAGPYTALVHLQLGSIIVGPGQAVVAGQPLGSCGNSGNSTQPHVHVQVTDTLDFATARGVPMAFRRFREWPRGSTIGDLRESGLPAEGSLVEPEPPAPRAGADPRAGALPEG
jgi:hypothetical protein